MTTNHLIIIPGQPIGKGRARSTRTGHHYTPQKTASWEDRAAMLMRAGIGAVGYTCPLKLEVTAYFQRPQRLMRKSSPTNRVHHIAKPDADNVLKIVCDALTKAGVVKDDAIINYQSCTKYYAAKDGEPQVAVYLTTWENEMEQTK